MLPIINRGTWARVWAYREMILKFLKAYHDKEINILSLGSGYDSTFFWLHDSLQKGEIKDITLEKLTYIEVDFTEVVVKKINIMKKSSLLAKIANVSEH